MLLKPLVILLLLLEGLDVFDGDGTLSFVFDVAGLAGVFLQKLLNNLDFLTPIFNDFLVFIYEIASLVYQFAGFVGPGLVFLEVFARL